MASYRKKGSKWYYRYVDASGEKRECAGCSDRRATEELAHAAEAHAAKIRVGLIDPRDLALNQHERRPLTEHLAEWSAAIVAKGSGRRHAETSRKRAARVLASAHVDRISTLTPARILTALKDIGDAENLNRETRNHYVRALKGFARWLWRDGRAREHQLIGLSTQNSQNDRRRVRRAMTTEEASRLIAATIDGPIRFNLDGPTRAFAYALAMETGLRPGRELSSLTPASFELDGNPPTVSVIGCYTKNKGLAIQPLSPALAEHLRPWLATRQEGKPVFPLPKRTADMIRADLQAAEIDPGPPMWCLDFYATRHTFGTRVVASGADVKEAQTLMRHSTPLLTIGTYARTTLGNTGRVVARLPDPFPEPPPAERINKHLAPHLPTGVGRLRRSEADTGGSESADVPTRKLLPMKRKA